MSCNVQNRGFDGLDGAFRSSLERFITASGGRVRIGNGLRTNAEQACLRQQKPDLAAPPGQSNHEFGFAADLVFADDEAREWAHRNAARYGLHFPMSYEPWHIEPIGRNRHSARGAYPEPSGTERHPHDIDDTEDRFDLGIQVATLAGMLAGGGAPDDGDLFEDLNTVAGELKDPAA